EAQQPDYISRIGDPGILGEEGDPNADFNYEMALLFWNSLYQNKTLNEEAVFYVNDTDIYGYQMTGYEPIFDENGNGVGVLALDVSMGEIKEHLNNYLLTIGAAAVALLVLFLVVLLTVLTRSVINPVKNLALSAHDFMAQSQAAGEDPEKLNFKAVSIHTGDEIELLGRSLEDMTGEIKSYMVNLKAVVGEKERIGAELSLATDIQVSMLPRIFPAFPNRPEIDIYATMNPAKEVGGDFYDFFFVDNNHLCVVVAYVSGQGVTAALFMVIAKTLIKNNTLAGLSMAQVFTHTNGQLCENNDAGLFVTAWAGLLEISTGKFTYVNAGHNPPLLRRAGQPYEYLRSRPGLVLAGMEGFCYRQNEMMLKEGDTLFLYTDGITEAANTNENLYGEQRLKETLNRAEKAMPQALLENVAHAVEVFAGSAPQSDDITMLGLRIQGSPGQQARS
ncbi:MAG: PP2C family protein-serine/threonine phosphatase, partial [Oscillospiraceae bacterium]